MAVPKSRMKIKTGQKHCFIESVRPCTSGCMAAYTVKGEALCLILWSIKNVGYAAERGDGIVQKVQEDKALTTFDKIEIIGSPQYINQITKALKLLKEKAPRKFATVKKYIGRIEDYLPSGMAAWEFPPTSYLSSETAFRSVTWCASFIVHEAHHSKLYLDYRKKYKKTPPPSVDGGRKIELECIKREIAAAKQIGAPDEEIQFLEKQDGTHYKQKITW